MILVCDRRRYQHVNFCAWSLCFTFSSVWVELPATTGWFADAKESSSAVRTKKSLMIIAIVDE
jgi:hypothetical protein